MFPSQDPVHRSLKALQKQDSWVDPVNDEHVAAFNALRSTHKRITVEHLKQYVRKQQVQLMQTAQVEAAFWVVDKDKLEGEEQAQLVAELEPYLVTEECLVQQGATNLQLLDFTMYHIVDQAFPREKLPIGSTEVKFFMAHTNKYKGLGSCRSRPQLDRLPSESTEIRADLGLSSSSGVAAGQIAVVEPAATGADRIHRPLKRVVSETEDRDCQVKRYRDVLKTLIGKIEAACARQSWWDSDPCNSDTVHFWAQECMLSANVVDENMETTAQVEVLVAFSKFLTKLLVDHDCYSCLTHFESFYETMETQHVTIPTITILVRRLAKLSVDSESSIETDGVDLEVRTRFFTSVLWKDFGNKRRLRRFDKALSSKCMQERVKLLRLLKNDASLAPELEATVAAALTIFDDDLPLGERVKYVIAEEWKLKLARDWSPELPIGRLVPFFEKDPYLQVYRDWDSFLGVCILLIETGTDVSQQLHPVLRSTLCYIKGIDELKEAGGIEAPPVQWKQNVLSSVVAARLDINEWDVATAATGAVDIKEAVPKALRGKVVKLTDKYLAPGAGKAAYLAWLDKMKAEVAEDVKLEQEKREAEKKVKEEKEKTEKEEKEKKEKEQKGKEEGRGGGGGGAPAASSGGGGSGPICHATVAGWWHGKPVVGDEVIVTVSKDKDKHNGFKALVRAARTDDATVEMLEGPGKGDELKIPYAKLVLLARPEDLPTPPASPKNSLPVDEAVAETPGTDWRDCASLFGDHDDMK